MLQENEFGIWSISMITLLTVLAAVFGRTSKKKQKKPILQHVLDERLTAFNPEPLVDYYQDASDDTMELQQPEEAPGILNLAHVNFFNFLNDDAIKATAINCIKSNGVGSCGPRGFYGSIDIHITLEERLAKFMNLEEAVIYSYGFSTISSAIGAYCKGKDIIFADERINFPSRQGFLAAKSTIVYFKHNDMTDLEGKLLEYQNIESSRKKVFRKFLIVEGIYQQTGNICPLPELMKLREKYMCRMFLDESLSFGVLGETGRGVTEHYNVDRSDIDMIMGSLEGTVASIGGFCVGASVIIEHQRLSGLGYCFSASLPPYLSSIAIHALDQFEQNPDLFKRLKDISVRLHQILAGIQNLTVISDPLSPVKIFAPTDPAVSIAQVHKHCETERVYLVRNDATLSLNVNVSLTSDQLERMRGVLSTAVNIV